MMNISDSSIEASFLGAEKGLAQNGVEPLDSYVVDDGWNNYNNEIGGVNAPGCIWNDAEPDRILGVQQQVP